jgi:uncharacterized protein with NRDE domain
MCLLLLAFHAVPDRPWLLLGNRDEYHGRATVAAAPWSDAPTVVGGRDLEAGGSWLALARDGRFAAVTNVRSGAAQRGLRSRGALVADFVRGSAGGRDYTERVTAQREEYGPFNLIVGDRESAFGASSLRGEPWPWTAGIHVLSNGPPEAPWPKMRRLGAVFAAALHDAEHGVARLPSDAVLLDLLVDDAQPADDELPSTGVGIELERLLAPVFIRGTRYGTRSSTLAYARADEACVLVERRYGPDAVFLGETRLEV